MSKVILSSIEDLKEEFTSKKGKPYFTVYNGHNKETKNVYHRSDDHSDMDSAWEELEGRVKKFEKNGGDFTVYCAAKEGATNGDTIYVRLGKTNDNTGIQGFNYIGGVDAYIEHKHKIWELERKLDDADNQAEPVKPIISDKIIGLVEKAIESDEGAGKMLLGGLIGLGHRFAAIGEKMVGIEPKIASKPNPKPNATKAKPEAQSDSTGYDGDKLIDACDMIAELVPNENPEDVIKGVASFLKKNPDMIQTFKSMQVNG